MKIVDLELEGLKRIELVLHGDSRGFFVERFRSDFFEQHGLPTDFKQDNHSRSAPGILRGLHCQSDPAQGKLVGVTRGKIWDVVVDIRPHSKTYGMHYGTELSDENATLLWIPAGFAHGFCVIGTEHADVFYKVDALYNPRTETGIHWADPELKIQWPHSKPTVSERDKNLQSFAEYRKNPIQWRK